MRKLFLGYFLLLLGFLFFSYSFVDPNLFYLKKIYTGFAYDYKIIIALFYTMFVLLFFAFYFYFLRHAVNKKINYKNLKILILITIGLLIFSYPAMLSYDIFNYFSTSKVLYFYGENPYLVMPIEFPQDSFLLFTRAANKLALYGPSWIALTAIPFFSGFGNFFLIILNFKLLSLTFYLLTIFIIFKLTKSYFSVSLFALNPLIIFETLMSAHNDIVMVFFSLFAFFLLMKKRIFLAILALSFGILIKYAVLFLLPVFLFAAFKVIKKEVVSWEKIFYFSTLLMLFAFLLSPIREEIYPWYAIWFLPFAFLIPHKKILLNISLAFSLGLLLRYIPYMFSLTYLGQTPIIKTILTFAPPSLFSIYYVFKKKI